MKTLILIAVVTQMTSASFLISPILRRVKAAVDVPVKAVSGSCNEANLKMCQKNFNKHLSISSDADFQNVDILAADIENLLLNKDVEQGLLRICQARSLFYQCLGSSYDSCMSRFHFLNAGQNITSARAFVQIFKELEFMCNGGLIQSVQEWKCIQENRDKFKNESKNCEDRYEKEMLEHPSQICENARYLMLCNQNFYQYNCKNSIGWWGCETVRISMDIDEYCPHLSCSYSMFSNDNKATQIRSKRDLFRSPNPQFMRPEKMNLFIQLAAKATEREKRRKRSVNDEE